MLPRKKEAWRILLSLQRPVVNKILKQAKLRENAWRIAKKHFGHAQ
jgi:hypothetical protein